MRLVFSPDTFDPRLTRASDYRSCESPITHAERGAREWTVMAGIDELASGKAFGTDEDIVRQALESLDDPVTLTTLTS